MRRKRHLSEATTCVDAKCGCKMWMQNAGCRRLTLCGPSMRSCRLVELEEVMICTLAPAPNPNREVVLAGGGPARGACSWVCAFLAAPRCGIPGSCTRERHELSRQGAVERISSFVVACRTRRADEVVVAWKRIYTCTKAGILGCILLHREWSPNMGWGRDPLLLSFYPSGQYHLLTHKVCVSMGEVPVPSTPSDLAIDFSQATRSVFSPSLIMRTQSSHLMIRRSWPQTDLRVNPPHLLLLLYSYRRATRHVRSRSPPPSLLP